MGFGCNTRQALGVATSRFFTFFQTVVKVSVVKSRVKSDHNALLDCAVGSRVLPKRHRHSVLQMSLALLCSRQAIAATCFGLGRRSLLHGIASKLQFLRTDNKLPPCESRLLPLLTFEMQGDFASPLAKH